MALRIVFCGTPAFAVPSLRRLTREPDFDVVGVVTQPDRPRGRGREVQSPAVKGAAVAAGIPVYQPEKIKSEEAHQYFRRQAPDAAVIIAYGQIVSQRLIDVPRLGWINLHASLLPKYRGAAPINWAIINGEARTGVTTMQIDAGLDTGPVLLKYETEIGADETAPELTARLAEAGAPLIVETLRKLERDEIRPTPQDNSQASFAPPLRKSDGWIEWELSSELIYARIRGLQPWPGASTTFRGKRCQVWGKPLHAAERGALLPGKRVGVVAKSGPREFTAPGTIRQVAAGAVLVSCGSGDALMLESVQLEDRKQVTAREFANGARLAPGERFGG